jgi:hypothetical protein
MESVVERDQISMERVLRSHLSWIIAIDCDYEWLYKRVLRNPIQASLLLVTPIKRDNINNRLLILK